MSSALYERWSRAPTGFQPNFSYPRRYVASWPPANGSSGCWRTSTTIKSFLVFFFFFFFFEIKIENNKKNKAMLQGTVWYRDMEVDRI